MPEDTITIPALYAVREIGGNSLRQLVHPEHHGEIWSEAGKRWAKSAYGSWEIVRPKAEVEGTALADTSRGFEWLCPPAPSSPREVTQSLVGAFTMKESGEDGVEPGLRVPQAGAIHSLLGYWSTRPREPATVVMPTGTGKTDTMIALFAHEQNMRLLVVVPSKALRQQIAERFEVYGRLQESGVVADTAHAPVVGRVEHRFLNSDDAAEFARSCNIIIATPPSLVPAEDEIHRGLFTPCTHLFIDEAHHVAAQTWQEIRDGFLGVGAEGETSERKVVQFTATPFRRDKKPLGGRIVYAFPLREAQRLQYFAPIRYVPVVDFTNQDRKVAEKAVQYLRDDIATGKDHLLMARVDTQTRTNAILGLYQSIAADLNPVILHSGLSTQKRREALAAVDSRQSKIIICVDMLGEGYDEPSLKVAAIHDTHRSLGVTLQFVGRFARVGTTNLGDATVVVPRDDADYDERLQHLYAQDADWNELIHVVSEDAVEGEVALGEFESGFNRQPDEVSIHALAPKMSAVMFSGCETWDPTRIQDLFPEDRLLTFPPPINLTERMAWFVTRELAEVRWGDIQTVEELTHHLYVMYWDEAGKLLYVNSSDNSKVHEELAKAVCGEQIQVISGEPPFRILGSLARLVARNIGVVDTKSRDRRFSMHVGSDVMEAFTEVERATKSPTHLSAQGYEGGQQVAYGAANKGRIWSHRAANTLMEWRDWCDKAGAKVTDEEIDVSDILRSFIKPELANRPPLVPLALEWGWEDPLHSVSESAVIEYDGVKVPFIDCDLKVLAHETEGDVKFAVITSEWQANYAATIENGVVTFRATGAMEAELVKTRSRVPLSRHLNESGLTILFEEDTMVTPSGFLLKVDRDLDPYNRDHIETWDWSKTEIELERQGPDRNQLSVQWLASQALIAEGDWDIVVDDDGPQEIADLVAVRIGDEYLDIKLVHCKASGETKPGYRVKDLYEVCGQAQKSARWRDAIRPMFKNLVRRERKRQGAGLVVGTEEALVGLYQRGRILKPRFTISIVQPGLSKAKASEQCLSLLGATELYVREIANATLEVVGSE